jgi:hypothetical protein
VREALLWGAGLVALGAVAVLVAVPFAIRSVVTPAFAAERASNILGRDVSVGAVGLHFAPLLRIRLERVAVSPDITLGAVDVALRIGALLERRIEPALVVVEDASFTLVRRANGTVEIRGAAEAREGEVQPDGEDSQREAAHPLPALPEIDLRRVAVAFVDHAIADPPLRTSLLVQRLQLESVDVGQTPSLFVEAALGEGGEQGLLMLDAELGPLEMEASLGAQPVRARLRVTELPPALLLPYLPSLLEVRGIEGAIEGSVALEGRLTGALEADLAVSVVEGGLDLAGVRLSAPRFEGQLERSDAGLALTKARLETSVLEFAEHQARGVRAAFSYLDDTVEVEALDLDSYVGSSPRTEAAEAREPGTAGLELHVERTGRIALRGRLRLPSESRAPAESGPDVELPDLEVQDAEFVVADRARPETPPVSLQVSRLHLRDFGEGETASYSLEARVGEGGGRGSLSLRGTAGPVAWRKPIAELPASFELAADAVDLAYLAPYISERWRPSQVKGRLTAKVDAEGSARAGQADVALTLEGGNLEWTGIGLGGRTSLEGRIQTRGDAVAFEGGRLSAETLSLAGRRADDLRTVFGFAGGALEIESLDLRAYDGTARLAGHVDLGEVPSFDLRVQAAEVDAGRLFDLAVEAGEPTLLEGEGAFQGRWTGEPNWLAPVRGGGRVALGGGSVPSRGLLSAVSRALLRLVPGSSRLLREGTPRLARLEALTSTFRVEDGRVRTDDLRVRTDDYRVSGRGSIGHELDLDFHLEVALTTRGVHKAFDLARTREELREGTMLPAIPVRVSGPVGSLSYRADASAVPVAALRGVLGLPGRAGAVVGGAAGTVRDAAGAVGGKVMGGARRLRGNREASEVPAAETTPSGP